MGKLALASTRLRKRAIVNVSPELILELLRIHPDGESINDVTIRCTEDAIPPDATVRHCFINGDMYSDCQGFISLVIQSAEFEEVKEGSNLPELRPIYTTEQ